jgi:adenosine kinase
MKSLIFGSIAYDFTMQSYSPFAESILPEHIENLNVAFMVSNLRREYGGCAANIAYNYNMLSHGDALVFGVVGQDGQSYKNYFEKLGIQTNHVTLVEDEFTAQAFITSDPKKNQITSFYPGAMSHSHTIAFPQDKDITIAILGPEDKRGTFATAQHCTEKHIPFIFDPGQALPVFSGEDLLDLVNRATYLTLNDYEAQLFEDKTKQTPQSFLNKAPLLKAVIITNGEKGSTIYTQDEVINVPVVTPEKVVEPTGCGDSYRAGLLFGINKGWDWKTIGRFASVIGAVKIAHTGGQNHQFTYETIAQKYQDVFGETLPQ